MDSAQLIERVRVHVELYDLSHPKYLDVSHKEKLWQEIGRELNQSAPVCKSRWGNIRDNYRKSLKKIGTRSGQTTVNIRRYKFFKQLSFLNKYLQEREPISNIICEESSQLSDEYTKEKDQRDNREREIKKSQSTSDQDSEREEQAPSEEVDPIYIPENRTRKRKFSSIGSRSKRNEHYKQTETASAALMKYLVEKKEHDEETRKQPDAVDAFLACLAPTLKNLPAYYLNIAKTKIFSIVQEYELKAIVEAQEPTATLKSSPSSPPPF